MNIVIIKGRLVRDPEVRYTQNGKVVTQITVAVDKIASNGEKEAIFVPCVFWNKQAEFIGNHFVKGQEILVTGTLNIRSYEAQDGSKRYVTEILAQRGEFCGSRDKSIAPANRAPYNANAGQQSAFAEMGEQVPYDEEIPF